MTRIMENVRFVGRSKEMEELSGLLKRAEAGHGQIIFVSGEAGVGKSRLVNELRLKDIGADFNWLLSRCIYSEGTDPYLPFSAAIRSWMSSEAPSVSAGDTAAASRLKKMDERSRIALLGNTPLIGPKLMEDPSAPFGTFMIKESKSEAAISAFQSLIGCGLKGLCITRIPPEKLLGITASSNVTVYWLSKKPMELCMPPSLTKLSHEIINFAKTNPGSVILLDGIDYVLGEIEFDKVLRMVNELEDSMALYKSILIVPVNPLTMDKKHLALLERDMTAIDLAAADHADTGAGSRQGPGGEDWKLDTDGLKIGRDRMFETITNRILEIAGIKPLVLFIADLHWADDGTLNLLYYLSLAIRDRSVAIICTYRPEEISSVSPSNQLLALINRMVKDKLVHMIRLGRFNDSDSMELIRSLFGNYRFPPELGKYIYDETEGNPFFVQEVLRSMYEEKVIGFDTADERWVLNRKIPEIKIPESIRAVVHARTDRLDKSARLTLESASVLGTEFGYELIAGLSELSESILVTILDDLSRTNLIIEQPSAKGESVCYRFAQNKIREVLYEDMGESRKRLIHKKAARMIEDMFEGELDSVIYELAHHYYLGGDYRLGLYFAIRAGEKALREFAPEKSKMFYRWALEAISLVDAHPSEPSSNKMRQIEITLKLTEISSLTGDWNDAIEYSSSALKLAGEANDNWKMVDAHIYAGRIHLYRSEWAEAVGQFKAALSIAEGTNYHLGMLEANYGLGTVSEKTGKYQSAMEFYQNYMELATRLEDRNAIAVGYRSFATIHSHRGEYGSALDYYQKCIELLTGTDRFSDLAKAYTGIGIIYFEQGAFDKVTEWNEKCIELAKRTGDLRMMGYGYSNAAEAHARLNNLEKAIEYANSALEIFTRLDERSMLGLVWMNFGIIHKQKSDWDRSRRYFEKSIEILKEQNVPYYLADCKRQFGLMLTARGANSSAAEGKKLLEESLEIYIELGATKYIDMVRTELGS